MLEQIKTLYNPTPGMPADKIGPTVGQNSASLEVVWESNVVLADPRYRAPPMLSMTRPLMLYNHHFSHGLPAHRPFDAMA